MPYLQYTTAHLDYAERAWAEGLTWKQIANDMTPLFGMRFEERGLMDLAARHRHRFPARNRGRPRTRERRYA